MVQSCATQFGNVATWDRCKVIQNCSSIYIYIFFLRFENVIDPRVRNGGHWTRFFFLISTYVRFFLFANDYGYQMDWSAGRAWSWCSRTSSEPRLAKIKKMTGTVGFSVSLNYSRLKFSSFESLTSIRGLN